MLIPILFKYLISFEINADDVTELRLRIISVDLKTRKELDGFETYFMYSLQTLGGNYNSP